MLLQQPVDNLQLDAARHPSSESDKAAISDEEVNIGDRVPNVAD